jgi:hypothetical protein
VSFAIQAVLLVGLLIVCCFAPGFFLVRWLRLTPMEKLCASVGASLILLYLVTSIVYLAGGVGSGVRLPVAPLAISSAVCVILGIAAWKDLFRLLRSFRVRHALLGYGFLFLWTVVILGMIRVYSGGHWSGDWQEHFQRTLFFFQRLPANTVFGDVYSLPSRPPFMNVLAAFFLAQTQDRFEFFQIVFTFLNLLMFLPACLLLPAVAGVRRIRVLPLVVLFALNPVVMQNSTYSWTRALTVFFVLLGVALYLSAWRKNDSFRMIAAFVSLGAGILVHYSAGPYVVFVTLHYVLWLFWRRPQKWKELAMIGTACAFLLASWFGWAIAIYGEAAFRSISTVSPSQEYQGSDVVKVAANLFDSIVPSLLRDPSLMNPFEQPNSIGTFRDIVFLFYQPNLVFGMGVVGGPVVLWLSGRRLRRISRRGRPERTFWFAFVLCATVLGAAVVGGREPLGLAYGTLLSLQVIGLILLASAIGRRRTLAWLVLAGASVDFSLGVFLHAHVQSMENGAGKSFFSDLEYANGIVRHADPGPDTLSEVAWQNWFEKHRWALCSRWLKELPERHGTDPTFQIIWPVREAEVMDLRKQDELQWGGWYSRHDGELTYLGDHVAGQVGMRVPAAVLLALLTALLALFIKRTPTTPTTHRKTKRGMATKKHKTHRKLL